MTAVEFIKAELAAGRLKPEHIEALTRYYQNGHLDLSAYDGKPGDETRGLLEKAFPKVFAPPPPDIAKVGKFLANPLPLLKPTGSQRPTVRKAYITSRFHTHEPGRPTHNGVDFFYDYEDGDQPSFVGDGGAAGKNSLGQPRWVVPYNVVACAAADGVVQIAGPSKTGFRVWIDHGNGLRSGYFHLLNLHVMPGQRVSRGAGVGAVGHNPEDNDARHLHFEVSPVAEYKPLDPELYLL